MIQELLLIANWKMELSVSKSIELCKQTAATFTQANNTKIVLCPTFPALYPAHQVLSQSNIALGAQNCATKDKGALTGEVSATTLAEIGVSYCIVGHSERRQLFGETNEQVAVKVTQLLSSSIIPIICVGETRDERQQSNTEKIIGQQLAALIRVVEQFPQATYVIAYEPVWSIGTGTVPDSQDIQKVVTFIKDQWQQMAPKSTCLVLYGGSVNETNTPTLISVEGIDGLLIGGASLEFQKFQKIVSLCQG